MLEFIIPLVLLPLLASSYAEVNYEGAKIIQVSDAVLMAIITLLLLIRTDLSSKKLLTASIL